MAKTAFTDTQKWWVFRSARGGWMVIPPLPGPQSGGVFPTGTEALAAFARGRA